MADEFLLENLEEKKDLNITFDIYQFKFREANI